MRRLLTAFVLAVLVLAGCGDRSDDTTTTGSGGDDPVVAAGSLDAEIVYLGEGEPPLDGPPGVQVLDPADPAAAAELFVEGEREAAADAVATAGLDGRTLLGGLVAEGCFSAGGVSAAVVDEVVVFTAEDLDPQEGEVDCARAVVTSALVSVATDALPDGFGGSRTTEPGSTEPAGGLAGEVVLLEPARYESYGAAGPGLVRDRVDLEAVLGRYGLGEPDPAVLARLETGAAVLVAGRVGGSCELPIDVTVRRTGDDLQLVEEYDPDAPEVVCDEAVQGLVLVDVDPADVEGVTTVDGDPADGPTGVGVVPAVEPLGIDAEPLAAVLADTDLSAIPSGPDLDLAAPADGAVRLVFVVEACQPDTAELVADLAAGTVRAEAQQAGDRVDCDALSPYLVIADLAADHADLEPVIG